MLCTRTRALTIKTCALPPSYWPTGGPYRVAGVEIAYSRVYIRICLQHYQHIVVQACLWTVAGPNSSSFALLIIFITTTIDTFCTNSHVQLCLLPPNPIRVSYAEPVVVVWTKTVLLYLARHLLEIENLGLQKQLTTYIVLAPTQSSIVSVTRSRGIWQNIGAGCYCMVMPTRSRTKEWESGHELSLSRVQVFKPITTRFLHVIQAMKAKPVAFDYICFEKFSSTLHPLSLQSSTSAHYALPLQLQILDLPWCEYLYFNTVHCQRMRCFVKSIMYHLIFLLFHVSSTVQIFKTK